MAVGRIFVDGDREAGMGVRPPSGGTDDEPASVEFGIAAVDARLRDVELSFPAEREEVVATLGEVRVPYDVDGNDVRLGRLIAELDRERFESRQELLNELHPQFERYREQRSGGVMGQLRALLPF